MKFLKVILIVLLFMPSAYSAPDKPFFKAVDQLLRDHVHNSLVDYAALKKDPKQLNLIVDLIADYDLSTVPDANSQKAFWLNAYNILVIKTVLDNYPIGSPTDVPGFFDSQKHRAAGEELTLNDIENKKVREQFGDARIHFALVCAALSCPPIVNKAFTADKIEDQLQERARVNLNDAVFIRVDYSKKTVQISQIFEWYKIDFENDNQSVLDYVNQFREKKIPSDFGVGRYIYDWTLNEFKEEKTGHFLIERDNLQAYTPSTLLRPGEVEIKTFNNLYTQTSFFDSDGNKVGLNERSTFYTNITSFLIGVKPNINIGFDMYFKSVRNGSAPFSVLKFSSNGNTSRTALTSFAPKIKVSPFSRLRNLSFQTLVLIPLAKNLEQTPFLDFDDVQWWTQAFLDHQFSNTFLVYFENSWFLRFDQEKTFVTSPTKAILNYYPSMKWTLYLPTEIAPTWDGLAWSSYYFQAGLGAKYQLTPNLEIEVLYTKFLVGKDAGAGITYNLGFRIIE